MNNVKNANMFKKAQPNLGEPPTDRISRQELFNNGPTITIQFPYNIQVHTPLIPHLTCQNLLKKANEIFQTESKNIGITDERKIIALETANKVESLDCYLTIPDKYITPLRSDDRLVAVMGPTSTEPKKKRNNFIFVKMIGIGGFSKVYEVRDKTTGSLYAMKVVNKSNAEKENKVRQMIVEKKIIEQFSHPFVVSLHSAFQTKNKLHFVMEFCPGGELFYHLHRVGKMSESQAKFYFAEVALGLEHMHSKSIIYRDLKPENILIDIDGHIRIADFGLSKEKINLDILTYSFCGSPEYMSPEMLLQQGHTISVDFYALGALLYEMITGLPPHYSQNREEMYNRIKYSSLQMPNYLSPPLKSLLSGLLIKDPMKRLGCNRGMEEIKEQEWCKDIDWMMYYNKKVTPPFKVNLRVSNFDPEYTTGSITSLEDNQRHDRSTSCYESSIMSNNCPNISIEESFKQDEDNKDDDITDNCEIAQEQPSPSAHILTKGCNKLILGYDQKFSIISKANQKKIKVSIEETLPSIAQELQNDESFLKAKVSISPQKKTEICKLKKWAANHKNDLIPNESVDTKLIFKKPIINSINTGVLNLKGKLQNLITPSYKVVEMSTQKISLKDSTNIQTNTSRENQLSSTQNENSLISNVHALKQASNRENIGRLIGVNYEKHAEKIRMNNGYSTPINPLQNIHNINNRNLSSARDKEDKCNFTANNNITTSRITVPPKIPTTYATNTFFDYKNKGISHFSSKSAARNASRMHSKISAKKVSQNSEVKITDLTAAEKPESNRNTKIPESSKKDISIAKHLCNHSSMIIARKPSKISIFNSSLINDTPNCRSSKKYKLQNIIRNAAIKQHNESMLKSAPLSSFMPHCKTSHDCERPDAQHNLNSTLANSESTKYGNYILGHKQNCSDIRKKLTEGIVDKLSTLQSSTSRAEIIKKTKFPSSGVVRIMLNNEPKRISHVQPSAASQKAKKMTMLSKRRIEAYDSGKVLNI